MTCRKESQAAWYQENKARISEERRRSRQSRSEVTEEQWEERKAATKARGKARSSAYSKTFKGRYVQIKAAAKKRGILFTIPLESFHKYWQAPCTYCGDPVERAGLDRVDNTKGYTIGNVVSCCKLCNSGKLDSTLDEFKERIARIHARLNG